jgi:hypothetical protein
LSIFSGKWQKVGQPNLIGNTVSNPKDSGLIHLSGDERGYFAYFSFNGGPDDDLKTDEKMTNDFFKLTRLCQARNGKFGFQWRSEHYTEGKRALWRNFIRDRVEEVIRETGFDHERDGTFFLPVKLDAESVANAIEQDAIEDALGPFRAALEKLHQSEPAFTRILEAAKLHFKT